MKFTPTIKENYILICSSLFILLWVYAAINKISTFEKFQGQLSQSPLILPFVTLVSYAVPIIELLLALLLAFRSTQLIALYGSFILITAFSFYIIAITKFSTYIPCSCGGILDNMSWEAHLTFNLGGCLIAGITILLYPEKSTNKAKLII